MWTERQKDRRSIRQTDRLTNRQNNRWNQQTDRFDKANNRFPQYYERVKKIELFNFCIFLYEPQCSTQISLPCSAWLTFHHPMNFFMCKINTSRVIRYTRARSFLAAVYNWYSLSLSLSHSPLSRTRPAAPPTSLTSLWRRVNIHVASVTWVRRTSAVISVYRWSISKKGGKNLLEQQQNVHIKCLLCIHLITLIILPPPPMEKKQGTW